MNEVHDFLDGEKIVGGLNFRPYTIGSKAACEQMRLTMFTDGTTPETEGESERQLIAFAWIQSQPLKEVIAALRNGTANACAEEFGWTVPVNSLPAIIAEINRISAASTAAAVEIIPKPGKGNDNAPGNSLGRGN
jgi:hypothetical protein